MEWPNEKALLFINEIGSLPILWNSSDPDYKTSKKKNETWENLAYKYGSSVLDLKNKWLSLQASYRRQRIKMTNSAKGTEKKITSTWFGFRAMTFLGDYYKSKGKRRTRNTYKTSETYQQGESRLRNTSLRKKHLKILQCPELSISKKREINEDNKPSEMYILKATVAEKERDENEIYGKYVALTLKKLDNHSRIMAKRHINDILVEAELGKYKNSISQKSSTPTYSAISPSFSVYSYQSESSNNISSE